jgi:hypothetical protein
MNDIRDGTPQKGDRWDIAMILFRLQKKGYVPSTSVLFAPLCGKLVVDKVDVPGARMTIERLLNNERVLQRSLML